MPLPIERGAKMPPSLCTVGLRRRRNERSPLSAVGLKRAAVIVLLASAAAAAVLLTAAVAVLLATVIVARLVPTLCELVPLALLVLVLLFDVLVVLAPCELALLVLMLVLPVLVPLAAGTAGGKLDREVRASLTRAVQQRFVCHYSCSITCTSMMATCTPAADQGSKVG